MDYKFIATEIIKKIGGKENIAGFEHCSTRLRFTLKDDSVINKEELENISGVLKVIVNSQCQVVIGNEVNEVYDEIMKLIGAEVTNVSTVDNSQKKKVDIVLDYLIAIFQPLVPALAGAGILKSLLLVAAMTPLLNSESSTYQILMNAADAALYFLPLLVAFTAAKKLKANELVAVAIVGMTIVPNMLSLLDTGATLFGVHVTSISYAYQVFPAILIVFVYASIEKFFTKYTPKPIRIFFVPMISILIMIPMALLILGPLGFYIGSLLTTVILTMYEYFGWVAVAVLAGLLPLMVATGMHKAFLPYVITAIGTVGYEVIYNSASLAHNISEAGMCYAVAIKTKDEDKRSAAISAAISASCGITEPALYGITLQNKQCMRSVVLGSVISGSFLGLAAVKAFVAVGPGIPSMTMFVDPADPSNIIKAIIGFLIALASSFIITFITYKEKVVEDKTETVEIPVNLNGQDIILDEVADEIFSAKIMGDGYASVPNTGILKSPVNASVEMIFETQHAIGLKLENGAELLIHIGIDTVNINENVFNVMVKVGDRVVVGQELVEFNLERIKELGYDSTIMFIITNSAKYQMNRIENNYVVRKKENNA